jgi:hypothetical protein
MRNASIPSTLSLGNLVPNAMASEADIVVNFAPRECVRREHLAEMSRKHEVYITL